MTDQYARLVAALLLVTAACGGDSTMTPALDGGARVDGGNARDGGGTDAGAANDAGVMDAGVMDAGLAMDAGLTMDAGLPMDAGTTVDGGPCHTVTFGLPTVPIRLAATLPTMTGGTIATGIYDAVDAQSTTMSVADGGTYRSTWSFVSGTRLDTLDQLTLSGTPPTPTPRSFAWSTTGARLLRNGNCSSTSMFDNEYRVQVDGGATYLEVRQSSVMFTFKKR